MHSQHLLLRVGTWWFFDRVFTSAAALITQVSLARILGIEHFGFVAYVTGVVALLFPVAQMGVGGLIGAAIVQNTAEQRRIVAAAAGWRLIGGFTAAVLGCVYWVTTAPSATSLTSLVLLSVALVPFAFSFLEFRFQALQIPELLVPWRIAATIIGVAMKLSAAWIGGVDLLIAAIALELTLQGLVHLLAYRLSSGEWLKPSFNNPWFTWLKNRSWILLISGVAEAFYLRVDLVMLGTLSTPAETAIYFVAARLSEVWLIIPVAIVAALAPNLFSSFDDTARLNRRLQITFDAFSCLAFIIIVTILLIRDWAIEILFGSEYAAASLVLAVHIWGIVFLFGRVLYSRYLLGADLIKESLISTFSGALINIFLNLLLIPRFGALGAAIATLVSYCVAGWLILYARKSTRHVAVMMYRALLPVMRPAEYVSNLKTFLSRSDQ